MDQEPIIVYKDVFALFVFHKNKGILEYIWTEDTAGMTDHDFEYSVLRFASYAKEYNVNGILIDVRKFRFKPGQEANNFHYTYVESVYNEFGLLRKAYLFVQKPEGQPGRQPWQNFDTRFFDSRNEAIDWLNGNN
jgi:hypothetical protein